MVEGCISLAKFDPIVAKKKMIVNGGVANTPVALLANHVHSSLASMVADDKDGSDYRSAFVLECLARMPLRLARAIGTKVFLEPFTNCPTRKPLFHDSYGSHELYGSWTCLYAQLKSL